MIVFTGRYKAIGILGGMGPEATAAFYGRLIKNFQELNSAQYDADYPEIFIYNLPLPDVVTTTKKGDIASSLQYGIRKLENAGADFIVAPCNTVNAFYAEMAKSAKIPIYSIIDETARKISEVGLKTVGILGTRWTLRAGLYDKALSRYGMRALKPSAQDAKAVTGVIVNLLKGRKTAYDRMKLLAIIDKLAAKGAQGVVLGCTELPLLISQQDSAATIFDSLQILADFTVRMAGTGRSGVAEARGLWRPWTRFDSKLRP